MNTITLVLILINLEAHFCQESINEFFQNVNENTLKFNEMASEIAWKSSLEPDDPNLVVISEGYQRNRIIWQHNVCDKLATLNRHSFNNTLKRMTYLLCRGPRYNLEEARQFAFLLKKLQSFNFKVCLPSNISVSKSNLTEIENAIKHYLENKRELDFDSTKKLAVDKYQFEPMHNFVCLSGEDDFEKLMSFSKNEEVLEWLWSSWREMGPQMKKTYRDLVEIENIAAIRKGYSDIGEVWRNELEVSNLRSLCRRLYNRIEPLYKLLHGVVRFFLRRRYGEIVPDMGYISAHLFGNLWSQSWDSIIDLITPQAIDLDKSIQRQNWTVYHMVRRAEDFYQSLGLPPMTDAFWKKSVLSRETEATRCHGAAADMFKPGDFRLIYCSGNTMQDFYVLHHEMGHIQYYMAYEDQPALFRQANTALHESIGDAIMYGVMTPQHLHRLGLINDTLLFNDGSERIGPYRNSNHYSDVDSFETNLGNDEEDTATGINPNFGLHFDSTDDIIMLKQALNKIPQIPFSLIIDEYRWQYFEGRIKEGEENGAFWKLVEGLSGITAPSERSEEYFDVAAKFHVPDNTPYIRLRATRALGKEGPRCSKDLRYFLSSFLQHQIFEALCKAAVFGRRDVTDDIPPSITMNRCDIYGSKIAGRMLKTMSEEIECLSYEMEMKDILPSTTPDHIFVQVPNIQPSTSRDPLINVQPSTSTDHIVQDHNRIKTENREFSGDDNEVQNTKSLLIEMENKKMEIDKALMDLKRQRNEIEKSKVLAINNLAAAAWSLVHILKPEDKNVFKRRCSNYKKKRKTD